MADQVNMQPQSPPYIIAPEIPKHIDAKGVVEAVRGVMQDTDKGFLPIKDIDLQKPYDLLTTHLKEQHERLSNSQIDSDNYIAELKDTKQKLVEKHENDFEKRIGDLESGYRDRMGEWKEQHRDMLELYIQWRDEWKNRIHSIETKKDALAENYKTALIDYYEKRLSELSKFHEDLRSELAARIQDLERRENDWKDKAEYLERERDRHLDERREWLRDRELQFDKEREGERLNFSDLRKQVVKNEHPLKEDIEQTAGQRLADKFRWEWAIVAALVVCVIVAGTICFCSWMNSPKSNSTAQLQTQNQSPHTTVVETISETKLTLDPTKNQEKQ